MRLSTGMWGAVSIALVSIQAVAREQSSAEDEPGGRVDEVELMIEERTSATSGTLQGTSGIQYHEAYAERGDGNGERAGASFHDELVERSLKTLR